MFMHALTSTGGHYQLIDLFRSARVCLSFTRCTVPDDQRSQVLQASLNEEPYSVARTATLLGTRADRPHASIANYLPGIERTSNGLVTFTRLVGARHWALGIRRRSHLLDNQTGSAHKDALLRNYEGKNGGHLGYLPATA